MPQKTTEKMIPEDYEFNLSDFALFLSVMKVKEAYEDVLSIILDESDLKLKEVKVEQVVLNKSGKRAIRLDAWALDVRDRQFDMEMQNDTQGDDIRKRSRFYQGMIDTPVLKSGKGIRYKLLLSLPSLRSKSRKRACSLFSLHRRTSSVKTWLCILSVNGVKKCRNCHWKTVRVKYS